LWFVTYCKIINLKNLYVEGFFNLDTYKSTGDRFTKGRKRRRKCTLKSYDRFTNS